MSLLGKLKYHLWTKPYTRGYSVRASWREAKHPFALGKTYLGKTIVGREILRDATGQEFLTGLYLQEGNKTKLYKLYRGSNEPDHS